MQRQTCPRSWQNPENRMKNSEQPASWRAFTKPPSSRRAQLRGTGGPRFRCPSTRLPLSASPLSLPISPHAVALGTLAPPETSQNLPSRSPHPQSPLHPGHRQARPLQVPRARSAPWTPTTWSCAQGKCVPVSASAIWRSIQKKPTRWNAAYHERIHRDQSNLIPLGSRGLHPNGVELLASDRYLQKGIGLMALTGRRPAEIFFSASFSLPREKLPCPALLFDGQLKTRQAPGTSFEPYPIPVLADPRKIIQALDTLRSLKSFPSPAAVNTTTGPQLPKYVSAAFGSLDLPWKPGHLRSAYGASYFVVHQFSSRSSSARKKYVA
jgi:Telomere resolvase